MERGVPKRQGESVTSRAKEIAIGAAETAGGLFISWLAYKSATELKEPGVTGLLLMTIPAFLINGIRHFVNAHRLNPNNPEPTQNSISDSLPPRHPFGWEI